MGPYGLFLVICGIFFLMGGGTNIDDFGGGIGQCVFISSESLVLGPFFLLSFSVWRSASTLRVLGSVRDRITTKVCRFVVFLFFGASW